MSVYECDQCGACCEGHLIVEADLLDLLREPRLMEAAQHYRGKSVDQVHAELAEPGRCIVLAAARPCVFLSDDCHCTIYATRPNECVAMQAGDEQCQRARRAQGLTPLEPVVVAGQVEPKTEDDSMDPDACYQEMIDAVEEADRLMATARKRAVALDEWLAKGGVYPRSATESEVRTVINQVFMRTEEADDE